ncbi:MAG: DUF3379 family protein [Betaproteobacteria bacterium]|nr:MAG: DUF3379 family protein [Betaproteobacteria bacterium]
MNCLEFRRAAMLAPRRLDTEALGHAERCPACGVFLGEALGLEAQIENSLDIPVPHGLQERMVRNALDAPRISRRQALVAGLALAATAGGAGLLWQRDDPLALAGIDFVVFEEAQAILDAKPADPASLRRAALQTGIVLPAQLGELRYIGTCPFAGATAHHVVLKTAFGKATLLLLPGRPLGTRLIASARGLHAAIAPASGGSVAIIADSSRGIARIESILKSG